MKFSQVLTVAAAFASTAFAAPVENNNVYSNETIDVPEEAIIAFMGFDGTDVAMTPFANATHSGVLFINSTIYEEALKTKDVDTEGTPLERRSADAHWLRLGRGEPLYKREADAEADAHWLRLGRGEPLYKREADAEADAHWLRLGRGEPLYKREAEADADADAHWLRLGRGEPLY